MELLGVLTMDDYCLDNTLTAYNNTIIFFKKAAKHKNVELSNDGEGTNQIRGISSRCCILRRVVLQMLYYGGLYYESKGRIEGTNQLYIIYKGNFLVQQQL